MIPPFFLSYLVTLVLLVILDSIIHNDILAVLIVGMLSAWVGVYTFTMWRKL